MNWSHAMNRARRCGKTHGIADLCARTGAVMVCMNSAESREIARKYGIRTVSATNPDLLRGTSGLVQFDPDAVGMIAAEYERDLAALRAENDRLATALRRIRSLSSEVTP